MHRLGFCSPHLQQIIQRQLIDLGSHNEVVFCYAVARMRPELQR